MYTLDQIYHRLNNGLEVPKMTTFSEPWTGLTSTVPFLSPAGSDGAHQRGVAWPNPRFTEYLLN